MTKPEQRAAPRTFKSEGQRLFVEATKGLPVAVIADRVRAQNVESPRQWLAGMKQPNARARMKIERALGIPEHAWRLRPGTRLEPVPAHVPRPEPRDNSAHGDTISLLRSIQRARRDDFVVSELVRHVGVELNLLKLVSQLERAAELQHDRFLANHSRFRRLQTMILSALEKHPEALRAVREAMARALHLTDSPPP